MKYQNVGAGWTNTSKKTGRKFIGLSFNDGVIDAILKEDLQKKICLFRADKKTESSPDFNISAPMPDSYVPAYQKPKAVEEDGELGI